MLKRIIDIIGSALGLVALSPLLLGLACAVKITSQGPVLYRQTRLGRGGRPFSIYKFRSMVDGAEHRGARVTGAGDARVTRLGLFLRRHKLDELPQLLNVLRGDMSLVGPRPEVPEFAAHYPEEFARVLSVRPGVTHRATQLFRNEEELLARAADPRSFYVERILPRKLAIYLADLDRATIARDLRTILDTVFNRSAKIELEFVAGGADPAREAAAKRTIAPAPVAHPKRQAVTSSMR